MKLKIGMVGFGGRGTGVLKDIILPRKNVEVTAVCDLYPERLNNACDLVTKSRGIAPAVYSDYKELIADENVNAIIVTTYWESHIDIAVAAMKAGKPVGVEVGGAYSLDDCWRLIHTYEETGTPCMLLENCCYGRYEMLVTNMVRQGLFGDIVHCAGGYMHDLRDEVSLGRERKHYRLRNYLNRNCENYPTHELGPIAKLLHINNGNRMVSLTSTASVQKGLHDYIRRSDEVKKDLLDRTFAQGDIITTVIKCTGGETITLQLDTTLPRPYCRGFTIRGTRGMFEEANKSIFLDIPEHLDKHFDWHSEWGNADKYFEKYEHPVWKKYIKDGVVGGHDGIDWLVYGAFIDFIENDTYPPIDVYDMAAWMAITPLSEESIARGSAPVFMPDFTNGKWIERSENVNPEYALD